MAVVVAAGCGQKQAKREINFKEEGPRLFGTSSPRATEADAEAPSPADRRSREAWIILIEAFRGDDRNALAESTLAGVRTDGGLPDAYIEERGDTTVLGYGRYPGPDDRRARADLSRIQTMEFSGARPYAMARLMPPVVEGSRPELDLRNAKKTFGEKALYTLQVGVYSREDGGRPAPDEIAEFRRFAEEAVAKLRADGDPAFYYHGPLRSMVTVGMFGADDFDAQTGAESAEIRRLREKFPYNLQNGKGVRERMTVTSTQGHQSKVERMQKSALVAVPDR